MADQFSTNQTRSDLTATAEKNKPKTTTIKSKIISLCSLFLITTVPLSITLAIIHVFGSCKDYHTISRTYPFRFPSLTLIHLGSTGSTLLMSLAAWLVWANGGFHHDSEALPLYISQVSLSILWDPLVLRIGSAWIGLLLCVVNFVTVSACYQVFGEVSPTSKRFVIPCFIWVGYLTLVTLLLVDL